MTAIAVCVFAFAVTLWVRTRSRTMGLLSVLLFGYMYGILRANLLATAGHFVFDSALLGLYIGELRQRLTPAQQIRENRLRDWIVALAMIPSLLLLLPKQDALVQIVGFRSAVLFLPFILLGARLEREDFRKLAIGVAILNLFAFSFAAYEYVNGIESLYPKSPITSIIYQSTLLDYAFHRIPATFSSSAAYGGTMVFTIPLIGMAISGKYVKGPWYALCLTGLAAGTIGVFLSASRSTAALAIVALVALFIENRSRPRAALTFAGAVAFVGVLVVTQPRLQRFLSLQDTEFVSQRFAGSVNSDITDIVTRYPFGNGLGAGGTSLPYFLQNRVEGAISVENEYARLILEQGVLGLTVWLGFIAWVLVPSHGDPRAPGKLGMRILAGAVFAIGFTGTGFLASIPATCFLFLMMGLLFKERPEGSAPFHSDRTLARAVPRSRSRALTPHPPPG